MMIQEFIQTIGLGHQSVGRGHLDPVKMALTWYILGISPPYDHVCDIGGIYQVYTWYIPMYFQT